MAHLVENLGAADLDLDVEALRVLPRHPISTDAMRDFAGRTSPAGPRSQLTSQAGASQAARRKKRAGPAGVLGCGIR